MEFLRIKDIMTVNRGASPRPISNTAYFSEQGNYGWVRISDVTKSDKYLFNTDEKLSDLGASFSVKLDKPTLFLSIAGSVGKACINKIPVCIHDGFVYFNSIKNYDINYLFWFFSNSIIYEGLGKKGVFLNLNIDTIKNILIPKLKMDEQLKISNFLDDRCSKIDKEIELLEKKSILLDEYKNALIYETVTKGLDKNAEMKDSGVEWIGDIPKHWFIGRVCDSFYGKKQITTPGRTDVLSLTLNGVIEKDIENLKGLNPESYDTYQIFKKDNLVFKLIDLENYKTSRVGKIFKDGIMSSAYIRLERKKDININYNYYQFFDLYNRGIYNSIGSNGVRSTLNRSDLLKIPLVVPPKKEQQEIFEFLDLKTKRIKNQIELINKKIELLKEYKQSLIYEAVTGQLEIE